MDEIPLLEVADLALERADAPHLPLVEEVSFRLWPGRAVALVGASGSGKTLTALALMNLLPLGVRRREGSIRLQGKEISSYSERQLRSLRGAEVAYIFQDPASALNPVLRVGRQVEEVVSTHFPQWSRAQRKARVLELLREVELPDAEKMLRRYPHQLSGGQRQRVLIAAALAGNPQLLVADEPTTALDVTVQEQILALLERLRQQRGLAMLWISHDLQLVRSFCQEVLVMYGGKLVERGTPQNLFRRPEHPHTQELVQAALQAQTPKIAEETASAEPLCRIFALKVRYPGQAGGDSHLAVRGVDLAIYPGETLALVGESGSGKTTLGRALLRMLPFAEGGILWRLPDGREVDWSSLSQAQLRPLRRHVGMVSQDPVSALNPRMRAWQSVAEPLRVHQREQRKHHRQRALALLAQVGLGPDQADAFPAQLSGGQCQRVAIARAIALEPQLVICDEAISALDAPIQEQILELLTDLQSLHGMAYLFITHDLDAVRHFADRVAVMREGLIVEQGKAGEILQAPEHPYTKRLLAAARAVHSKA